MNAIPAPRPKQLPAAHPLRAAAWSAKPLSVKALLWCLGGLGVSLFVDGLLKLLLIDRLAWSGGSAGLVMGSLAVAFLGSGGFLAGRAARKLCLAEAVLTALFAFVLAQTPVLATSLWHQPWVLSIEPQVYQLNVIVGAAGVGLATFVGTSLGFMLAGGGALDLGLRYELFVALTFLRLRGQGRAGRFSPSAVVTGIAILAVVIGMMALTVVLSVMSGFEQDLKHKILGTNAHAIVMRYGNDFRDYQDVGKKVLGVRGVIGETPFTLNEVMVSSENNLSGVVLKGIDPDTVGSVTDLAREVTEGDLAWLRDPTKIPIENDDDAGLTAHLGRVLAEEKDAEDELHAGRKEAGKPSSQKHPPAPLVVKAPPVAPPGPALPGIVLGRELAKSLRVFVGDKVNVVSPLSNELGPSGPIPKSRPFRVAALFYSGMYEYDSKFAYLNLPEAQKFFGTEGAITGLEIKVDDLDATRRITRDIMFALDGYPYHTKDWGEMNKNLFAALAMEKLVMAIILGFASLPVGFLILSILMFLAFEKSKEIAVLKSMGARDQSIMKVFVLEGLIIGGVGAVLGLAVGLGICLFIAKGGIKLDPSVYYIDALPVRIELWQFGVVGLSALMLSYLATMYPAVAASRLSPVEGLRNE